MGVVKEIQTVLDNIACDVTESGQRGQLLIDEVRDEARASGVSDYFINHYINNFDVFNYINYWDTNDK
jgi:hypothetical protein